MLIAAGKVVYDLLAERDKRGDTSTAILRLEQYYPLPAADLAKELGEVPRRRGRRRAGRAEEPGRLAVPRAQPARGAGRPGEHRPLRVISRAASASPATGSTKKHQAEQADLVAQAFDR